MTVRHHRRGDKTFLCEASYGQLRLPYTPKEDTDVLPPPCDRMDSDDPDPLAQLEQTASYGLGAVEPGPGAGPLLCVYGRQCVAGVVAGLQSIYDVSAVAGVVIRTSVLTRGGEQ